MRYIFTIFLLCDTGNITLIQIMPLSEMCGVGYVYIYTYIYIYITIKYVITLMENFKSNYARACKYWLERQWNNTSYEL